MGSIVSVCFDSFTAGGGGGMSRLIRRAKGVAARVVALLALSAAHCAHAALPAADTILNIGQDLSD